MTPIRRNAVVAAITWLLVGSTIAAAQVSPVGVHDTTSGPGTGAVSPVSPTGTYHTAVPLDLPAPRGAVPIPLSVVYNGGSQSGAPGLGWEIPIFHIRASQHSWHRKPAAGSNSAGVDVFPRRMFLVMGGGPQLLVQSSEPGVYRPFVSSEYVDVLVNGDGWLVRTASNLEYRFSPASVFGVDDDTLWLLVQIRDRRGTDRVDIEYTVDDVGCGTELDVGHLRYGFDSAGPAGAPLYDVELQYRSWTEPSPYSCPPGVPADRRPFAASESGARTLIRSRLLSEIRVIAKDNLTTTTNSKVIRSYSFEYQPDRATSLPRLTLVDVKAGSAWMPVARYEYGSVVDDVPWSGGVGWVRYSQPSFISRDPSAEAIVAAGISGTVVEREVTGGLDNDVVERAFLRHAIRDLTGDGVPDLVYRDGSTWHLTKGRVMDSGVTLETGETISWQEPGELSYQRTTREEYFDNEEERRQAIVTEVMTKLVDWNGDGRLDVLDAKGPDDFHWTLWQNNPGPGGMPSWTKVLISNGELREHIVRRNLGLHPYASGWVALERSRSWQQFSSETCQTGWCLPDPEPISGRSDTVAEWSLEDANADGFVDIVASANRIRQCENQCVNDPECDESPPPGLTCVLYRAEWVSDESCGPGPDCQDAPPGDEELPENSAVVYLNRRGAIPIVADRSYEPTYWGRTSAWSTGAVRDLVAPDFYPVEPGLTFHVEGYLRDSVGRPRPVRDHRDGFESFESTRHEVCGLGGGGGGSQPFQSRQRDGIADINGDGRPDHVWNSNGQWKVAFGTSAGFALAHHPIAHIEDGAGFPFDLSASEGACTGATNAVAGLLDVDGDGKPELVRVVNGVLMAASIASADGDKDALGAGRLVAVENGFGARTEIRYANNKAEMYTSHQVAIPEIVVARTQVTISDGSAPNSAPTLYAYGGADNRYDFVTGRVGFTGYRKHVTLSGEVKPNSWWVRGTATLVERAPPAAPYTTYSELVTGGRSIASLFGSSTRER